MWPSIGDILSVLQSVIVDLANAIIDILKTAVNAILDLIIDSNVYVAVYNWFKSQDIMYIVGGAFTAALARKLIFTGSKTKDDMPFDRAIGWTEDIVLGSNAVYFYRQILITLVIMPIVIPVSLILLVRNLPVVLYNLIIDVFKIVIKFIYNLIVSILKIIIDTIMTAVNAIKDLVEAIWNGITSIIDLVSPF